MSRRIVIDVDENTINTEGPITEKEMLIHAGTFLGYILDGIGKKHGWQVANHLGGVICAYIAHHLDRAKGQHP